MCVSYRPGLVAVDGFLLGILDLGSPVRMKTSYSIQPWPSAAGLLSQIRVYITQDLETFNQKKEKCPFKR